MMARVHRTIEEHSDKVHVLALCGACAERVTTYGIATQASDPEYLIV
jgi:CRISPR/Cas system-associated endoribonuclease Cas2